jgi:hypothetical protein
MTTAYNKRPFCGHGRHADGWLKARFQWREIDGVFPSLHSSSAV